MGDSVEIDSWVYQVDFTLHVPRLIPSCLLVTARPACVRYVSREMRSELSGEVCNEPHHHSMQNLTTCGLSEREAANVG
jgi:hypothetical protein